MKILLTLLASACVTSAAVAAEPQSLTLERITADPPLAGRLPRQAEVSPGGQWVSFLRPSQADSEVLELWAQPSSGGEPRRLVSAADLLGGAEQKLSEAEKMALERQRINQRGITGYQWCGGDDSALLFPLSGDLYLVRLGVGGQDLKIQAQRITHEPDAPKLEPRCTPDGKSLAYVQNGNLFVLPLAAGGKPHKLTTDGSATVSWGVAEFIAAEELGRQRGYWWSRDGKSLLALRVDESGVAVKTRAQIFADRTAMTQQRYPAAGEANAKVTAFVIDAATGQRRELPLPETAEYISRAGWFADGTPWLQWFTRDQTRLTLTEFKAGAAARDITVETDVAWVEVHDDLIETAKGLLWSSEASGRRQLLLVDRASGARTPLTQQPEPIAHAICANAQSVVFAAAGDRGKSQELYSLPLAGGKVQALPGAANRQWRDAKADSGCGRLLVTRSAWGQPPRLELRSLGQDGAIALAGDPPDADLKAYTNTPLALDLMAADGRTPLNAFFFPAQDRRAGKHPVIVMAYGGPGAATVTWGWGRDMPLIAHWQQRGYGV
ncbi:MAG: DPP IV N-terminal domain-containing protein, partial [Burkholderiales bacterium]|nr:DPP IV N-terminal domain-containing protein [Burkholderiales bacterium]